MHSTNTLIIVNVFANITRMATRTRPPGCCAPASVRPLARRSLEKLALVAKALADPTRIEVLRFIAGQTGPVCACDIVARFDLSQPTMSHHLKTLKNAGLVVGQRAGLWSMYDIDPGGASVLDDFGALVA